MRVALDARVARRPSGIGQYVYNLARAAGQADPDLLQPLCHARQVWRFRRYGLRPAAIRHGDPSLFSDESVDVIHGPNFHAPPNARAATVATIHDLGFIQLPECHPPGMPEALDAKIREGLSSTDRFICVSEDTLHAFAEHYAVSPDRCDHVPHGVDTSTFHPRVEPVQDRLLRLRHRLHRPFVLFVGAMVPRKDIVTLLDAFALIAHEFPEHQVVVAGHKTRRWASDWPRVQTWLHTHRELRDRLRVLRYIPASQLPHLYRACEVVALPSLTEGFGLTVLEGFASGKPVVTTDAGALPEVGGDGAYRAPPRDAVAFADALKDALSGRDRARRSDAAAEIVARHSWSRAWALTRRSYESATA